MNFSQAMEHLLAGYAMRRRDWGRTLYVNRGTAIVINDYVEVLMITMKSGDIGVYTPTQCDIFGNDWEQVK